MNKEDGEAAGFLVAYSALKNHRWFLGTDNAGVVQTPNDLVNSVDNTWENNGKVEATYNLPFGFTFAAFDQIQQGFARQRTFLFALPTLGSETVRLAPYGQLRLPTTQVLSVSVQRSFLFADGKRRLVVKMDVYNALNKNTATAITDTSGPNS